MAKTSYVPSGAKIKVIGMGGAGCNAITRMVRKQIRGVDFIAMNTDAKHLAITEAPTRIEIGEKLTRGLGAGGDRLVGQKSAEESLEEIRSAVSGADMIFLTAGMGGGTGTGSIPVVAEAAKKTGALTIGIVTKPFAFEGSHRMRTAEDGIAELLDKVDTLLIIPNERLFELCDNKTGVDNAFELADDVLFHAVQAIAEVITVPGLINLDFADVRTIMKDGGSAWMSIGHGTGGNRAIDAAKDALASPLLDVSIDGARGVMFNIAGDSSLSLFEVNNAAEVIRHAVEPDANIIFGVTVDPTLNKEARLTLIATGFDDRQLATSNNRERDMMRMIDNARGAKSEDELAVPAFMRLRRSSYAQRSGGINSGLGRR